MASQTSDDVLESEYDNAQTLSPTDALAHIETIIGAAASTIISSPEHNLSKLKDLLACLNRTHLGPFNATDHRKTVLGLHRLVAKCATKIYIDIIPSYRIKQNDQEQDEREKVKLSKEVAKLRQFERNFASIYKNSYLDYVKRMLDSVKNQPSSTFYSKLIETRPDEREQLAATAIDCFGRILVAHPHFNYRDQLIQCLVDYNAQTKHENCALIAHNYLTRALKTDMLGEVSLEIVSSICEIAKKRKLSVSYLLFKTLLSVKLIDVKAADADEKEKRKAEREKLAAMKKQQSRKERKRDKKMKKLKRELLETEAHTTTDQKLKFHRTILKKLFLTYFRLLKYHEDLDGERRETQKFVKLLPPVLEGVAKFAHLIDVNLCNDMFPLMKKLLGNPDVSTNCKLHCLSTVFIMLKSLETELGRVDPEGFYKHFYVMLSNLNTAQLSDHEFYSLDTCIHLMLIKRAKHINNKRYCAFVRRLLILALNIPSRYVDKLLSSIRIMFLQRSSALSLLDSANCADFGSGQYDMEIDDPEYSHADSTVAWELHMLRRHNEPVVRNSVTSHFGDLLLSA